MEASLQTWTVLAVLVIAMLVVDFQVFARGGREVSVREAGVWSLGWLALALGFGALLWGWQGGGAGSEYLAGYLLERSLSLDNVFVFAVIFAYFAVPVAVQPRVLAWGIALALVLRLGFIVVGAALLATFHATFYAFGALLLYTAWKLARHDDTDVEPEHNAALRLLRRHVPMTARYHGQRLTVRAAGRRVATPLLAVFVVVATTDVVFAIDSIPAIFAITQDPFIVFAANAFAMLGLRALYFLLSGAMERFAYLSYGLAAILAFIGAKMLLVDVWHPPIWASLAVIVGVLALTALASVLPGTRRRAAIEPIPASGDPAAPPAGDGRPRPRLTGAETEASSVSRSRRPSSRRRSTV